MFRVEHKALNAAGAGGYHGLSACRIQHQHVARNVDENHNQVSGFQPTEHAHRLSALTPFASSYNSQSIDFNAADTEMELALEALPNVGSVSVNRKGPDGQLGYSWYVTFVENPGSFPAGSGDVALLSTESSSLGGDGAWCTVEEMSAGTPELSGAFVLAFTASDDGGSGGVTRYTDELPYNSLAEEVRPFRNCSYMGMCALRPAFGVNNTLSCGSPISMLRAT